MAKDYNSGQLIPSDNEDGKMYFEDLRWAINKLVTDTNRRKGLGKSSFSNYNSTKQNSIASTITTELSGNSISGSPYSAGINVIQDLKQMAPQTKLLQPIVLKMLIYINLGP